MFTFVTQLFGNNKKYSSLNNNNAKSNNKIVIEDSNSSNLIQTLDNLFYFLWYKLWFQFLDQTLSCLFLTTHEQEHATKLFYTVLYLKFLILLAITILLTPIGCLFYLVWFFLFRKLLRTQPYQISRSHFSSDSEPFKTTTTTATTTNLNSKEEFEIFSMNVCLLPDTVARLNNMSNTQHRLQTIGNILSKSETNTFCSSGHLKNTYKTFLQHNTPTMENHLHFKKKNLNGASNHVNVNVIDDYIKKTNVDFVCLQEVWTIDTAKKLKSLLHKNYPYIIYDAGTNHFLKNRYIGFDSGLIIASKYPILNANFKQYSTCSGSCSLTSKGLLTIKVYIGQNRDGKNVIGYVSNCHLQAYQKTSKIHSIQLEEMRVWVREFKEKSFDPRNEMIAFDLICGDFNLDNMSPVDKCSYEHKLFMEYQDPLSLEPGVDHPCAIGTELRHFSIYDSWTSTPNKFRTVLENDRARRMFIIDSNIESATEEMVSLKPELDEDGLPLHLPKYGGNRRVDRILYCKKHEIELIECNFIASFTRLSDHLPISLKFKSNLDLVD